MAPVCGAPCQPEDSSGDSEASEASLLLELSELPVCWPHLLGSSEKADEGPKGQSHQIETLPELPGFPEVPEFEIEHIPSTPVRAVSEGATSLPSACAVDTAHTFSAAAGLLSISAAAASPTLTQLYTPASPRSVFKLQVTPKRNYNGDYRQYNPHGADWGNMSWYHTVAQLDSVALTFNPAKYPYASGGFYSGSFGSSAERFLAAVKEWQEDPKNPIISEFPDKKRQRYLAFMGASLLREDWKFDSVIFEDRYVPLGMFECPDLFELPGGVWVLKVSTMVVTVDYYRLGVFDWDTRFFDPILKSRIIFAWSSEAVASKIPHMGLPALEALRQELLFSSSGPRKLAPWSDMRLPALEALRQELLFSSSGPRKLAPWSDMRSVEVDMEPFMLLDVSGGGTAPVPPGLELQQEILASFTFPVEPQRV
ncbi:Beta-fructofuranosidase, insoluble isoenzyme CWINV2 [Symbiodinium microadriaticum]|uniref:Beta-fructofuranosidase, insoluble isoenzyme CWINV2 n=1 Tax=Symbiodinium microadriaticum TaxID=2951 RepID=A0A1Q9DI06_SYMMI|nr:Beta-fructofuranosidase, insoluble isoenzyme CWINV2 [Symbiodinium microadriaticum]